MTSKLSEKDLFILLGDTILEQSSLLAKKTSSKEESKGERALSALVQKDEKAAARRGGYQAALKVLGDKGVDLSILKKYDQVPLSKEEVRKEELFKNPVLSSGAALVLKLFEEYSPIRNLINSYNRLYSDVISIIKNTVLTAGNGQIIVFEKVIIQNPTVRGGFMTPQEARTENYNYFCPISASVRIYSKEESAKYRDSKTDPSKYSKRSGVVQNNFVLDEFPCMLGSDRCYTQTFGSENRLDFLVKAGEDPTDHFGYFISGGEHILPITEKLRMLKLIVHLYKGDLEGTLTIPDGWTSIRLKTFFDGGYLKLDHSRLKTDKRVVDVFHLFDILYRRALGEEGEEEKGADLAKRAREVAESVIASFVPKDKSRVRTVIVKDYAADPYEPYSKLMSQEDLEAFVDSDLFPHLPKEGYQEKFYLLAMIASRMYACKAGVSTPDDRDSWAHKRLMGPASTVGRYFRRFWNTFIKKFTNMTNNRTEISEFPNLDDKIWKKFKNGFSSGKWGERNTATNNVSQRVTRHNTLALFSQTLTVDVQADKQNQSGARAMQADQYGFICSVFTPEGKDTGIKKMAAVTCKITDKAEAVVNGLISSSILSRKEHGIQPLSPLEGEQASTSGKYMVLLNLKPIAWANLSIAEYCRSLRRLDQMPRNMEVVVEGSIIYLHTDGARLVRPVLVVDPQHQLLIDELGLRDSSLSEIMGKGVIDYISPWEQNSTKVAIYPKDLKVLDEERAELRKVVLELEKRIESLEEVKDSEEKEALEKSNRELGLKLKSLPELDSFLAKHLQSAKAALAFKRPYAYCELDPITQFGVSALFIPASQHNPAARNVYQTSMNRQALSNPHSNQFNRFDSERKALMAPQRPIFSNSFAEHFGLNARSHTTNVVIAFMSGSPYTPYQAYESLDTRVVPLRRFIENEAGKCQEDNITLKKEAKERGLFLSTIYHIVETSFERFGEDEESFGRPVPAPNENKDRYHAIDENGMPIIGSYVKYRDCIIGKIFKKSTSAGPVLENRSKFAEKTVKGYIQNVVVSKDSKNCVSVVVKIAQTGFFNESNKIAAIPAQKGTVNFVSEANLPYTKERLTPDMLVNPHSIGSRQTISYLIEVLVGKYTMLTGNRVDGTAFREFDIPNLVRKLAQLGMDPLGYETLYDPVSGSPLPNKAFIGVVSIQVLRHFADQKIQSRAWHGATNSRTRQPNKPSSGAMTTAGGNRYGEQERISITSHGAAGVIQQVLGNLSDSYSFPLCPVCKGPVVKNHDQRTFFCSACGKNVDTYLKGTNRYASKYFAHISAAVGIGISNVYGTERDVSRTRTSKIQTIDSEGDLEVEEEEKEEED